MKSLALLLVLLVWPTLALAQEGPSTGNFGGIGPGDVTVNGTLTANAVNINPALNAGGCLTVSECEGGAGCPAATAGHDASLCLPDNATPLADHKTFTGIRTCSFALSGTPTAATTGYFVPGGEHRFSGGLANVGCKPTFDVNTYFSCSQEDSIYIGTCRVYIGTISAGPLWGNEWSETTDTLFFSPVIRSFTDGGTINCSDNALDTNKFEIRDNGGTACNSTTCQGGRLLNGPYVWEVNQGYASAGSRLAIGMKFHSKTDGDDDIAPVNIAFECEYW